MAAIMISACAVDIFWNILALFVCGFMTEQRGTAFIVRWKTNIFSRLCVSIYFLRIRIQLFFSIRIWIHANADPDPALQNWVTLNLVNIILWGFCRKRQYLYNWVSAPILFYFYFFKNYNYKQLLLIFHIISLKFSPPGSVYRRKNDCDSKWIRIHSPK